LRAYERHLLEAVMYGPFKRSALAIATGTGAAVVATSAQAAAAFDGAAMPWPWALPFAGLLLTIALGPLLFPHVWHRHYGKIAAAWAIGTLGAMAVAQGGGLALHAFVHTMLTEYLSFIVLLFALYTVAGGILITGNPRGTPLRNTAILGFGAAMASVVGTTGAAMILIRPLLRANDERPHQVHVVVFFIFLVANIGGALTPLGDPPLFVGFLRGIDFTWPAKNLALATALVAGLVLALFFILDCWLHWRERHLRHASDATPPMPMRLHGIVNLVLIAAVVAMILISGRWKPGVAVTFYGTTLELQNAVRDGALVAIALLSVWLTRDEHRHANGFSWEPIREVAKLFAAIFVCIIPVLAMLDAGRRGAFSVVLGAVTDPDGTPNEAAYFWLTGLLSAFLDNAPTYLVFFELAGGNPAALMGPLAPTLAAISMGAVYMGALTYIGNAPNLMVYAIAVERGVKMPSFFGYMLWSVTVLAPMFVLLTFVSIRQP
jgi:Na+/H+ antiporter NhaD/arsenite permease-like protein